MRETSADDYGGQESRDHAEIRQMLALLRRWEQSEYDQSSRLVDP